MKWPVRKLEQLAAPEPGSIKIGPFGSQLKKEELVESGVHVVGIENVIASSFDGLGDRHITQEKFQTLRSVEVKPGDVLITMMGTIGEAAVVPSHVSKSIMDSHLLRFRSDVSICLPEYVAWLVKGSGLLRDYMARNAHGAIMKGLNSSIIRSLPAPLPPLIEQQRIVSLLDGADELRRLREQADRRTADLIPALFFGIFGDPAKKQHPIASLSDVAEVVSGVAKGRRFDGKQTVTVPYIRVANVQAGFLDLSEIKTIEALPGEVKDLALKRGDVLLTEGGDFDKLGRGALWEREIPDCIHQNHIFRVRVNDSKLTPVFFMNYLLTSFARKYFLQCAKRTTNLASINMTQLRGLPVPLPPLPLQRQFAARVAEIRALQSRQAESRRRLDDLFQSMLHRAFQGEI